MFTTPSSEDLIEGVIVALQENVLPELSSERAQVIVVMAQAVLASVAQRVPVELQIMAQEHNEMTSALRDIARILGPANGPEADRIRERAETLGSRPDFGEIPATADVRSGYYDLSAALCDTLRDLDPLIMNGDEGAERALQRLREHLGPRTMRDFTTHVVGAGMAGRG